MRTSIATVCLSGTLAEKLRAAADAGFDGVEIFEQDLVVSPHTPEQIRQRAQELGITLDLYQPFRDLLSVEEDVFSANLRRLEAKFQLMNRLGIDTILVCSNVDTATIDDDTVRAAQLRRAGDLAQQYGCRIAYEALAWGKYVNTYEHAHRIVMAANHPNVGTCLDSFHILSRGDRPQAIATMDPEKIFFVQLADAPRLDMGVLSWSRHHRLFPGQGDFDLVEFMSCLQQCGYSGPVSLEIFNDQFREAAVARTAVDGLRSLLWLDEQARAAVAADAGGAGQVDDAAAQAFDFLELRTGELGAVTRVLHQLGFQLGGFHQSKPEFQLWHQHGVNIVLGDAGPTGSPTELVGVGVKVADPEAVAARAERFLAPSVPRSTADGEQELYPVLTPSGVELSFGVVGAGAPTTGEEPPTVVGAGAPTTGDEASSAMGGAGAPTTGEAPDWRREFGHTATADLHRETDMIHGIDHVAFAQPELAAAATRLFYTSVLGLRPGAPEFVPSPAGLVHKQAMTAADVHLVVSVAPSTSEQGDFLQAQFPEHISLATNDVFAVAERAQQRGLRMLQVPSNYYEDLAARFDLPEEFVAQLQRYNICFDRDDQGEYLHFFTEVIGQLCFEVAQRRGNYQKYGWQNEPVRLAAQYRALRDTVRGIPN